MNFVCEATLTLGAGTHTIYGRQANHGTATIDASAKFVFQPRRGHQAMNSWMFYDLQSGVFLGEWLIASTPRW